MADNFLERQMEDYKSGKLNSSKFKGKTSCFSGKKILIVGNLSTKIKSLIECMVENGFKVAFTHADLTEGNKYQQQTGTRFYNIDPAERRQIDLMLTNLTRAWKKIDMIIVDTTQCNTNTLLEHLTIQPSETITKGQFSILTQSPKLTEMFSELYNDLCLLS